MGFEKISLILSAVVFAFILACHALSVFSDKKISLPIKYIGISLHLPLTLFLFFCSASLKIVLLIFTFSTFVYTLLSYVRVSFLKTGTGKDTVGEEVDEA